MWVGGGGGGEEGRGFGAVGGGRGVPSEKKKEKERKKYVLCIPLFFVLMLYIKFQVLSSSGSLVLTQTKVSE